MHKNPKSSVTRTIRERLKTSGALETKKQKQIAVALGVKEAAFSKRLKDLDEDKILPDDRWVVRLAQLSRMRNDEIRDLLIQSQIERASTPEIRELWEGIGNLCPTKIISATVAPSELLRECLGDLGMDIPPNALEEFIEQYGKEKPSKMTIDELVGLHARLAKLATKHGSKRKVPSLGRLIEDLLLKLNIRVMRPFEFFDNSALAEKFVVIQDAKIRCAPILPGLMGYLIEFQPGGKSLEHAHSGLELATALKGITRLTFQGSQQYVLDAKSHDSILYNSDIPHFAQADECSALLVAHYEAENAKHWPKILSIYHRTLTREKASSNSKNMPSFSVAAKEEKKGP